MSTTTKTTIGSTPLRWCSVCEITRGAPVVVDDRRYGNCIICVCFSAHSHDHMKRVRSAEGVRNARIHVAHNNLEPIWSLELVSGTECHDRRCVNLDVCNRAQRAPVGRGAVFYTLAETPGIRNRTTGLVLNFFGKPHTARLHRRAKPLRPVVRRRHYTLH